MGRIELRRFKWVLDKIPAIREINKFQGEGIIVAKQTYERIDKFTEKEIYIYDKGEGSNIDDLHYISFLDHLKYAGIIDFNTFDFDEEWLIDLQRESQKEIDDAYKWLKQQPEDHQKIIETLMNSVSVVYCGG